MNMKIPSKEQCYQLIHETGMMDHIAVHSIQVCRVAMLITEKIVSFFPELNQDLINASALLHDITKTKSLETGEKHAQSGELLLTDMGYPEVGYIVGQHVRLARYQNSDDLVEAEIVNYADKRVTHDKITSLSKRMDYIMDIYGKTPEHKMRIKELGKRTKKLEDKIFEHIRFSPDKIDDLLEPIENSDLYISFMKHI
ncbi:MAG: HD domain-containing protein [Desulfobacterales bacterium]|nr:HD domain-containing protein [Desulfobacterales bacterium]